MSIITCPHCGTKNRVDESRATHEQPKCGKCGNPLPASGGSPLTVTDDTFAGEVLGTGATPVLVDCWAAWCGPCLKVAPVVDELAAEAAGRWKITKLNIDQNPRVAAQFRIESIPTLLIFKSGKLVDQVVGLNPKTVIAAKLMKWA